jgi:hypothetical protein
MKFENDFVDFVNAINCGKFEEIETIFNELKKPNTYKVSVL